MAKYDHGGDCNYGLYKTCQCTPVVDEKPKNFFSYRSYDDQKAKPDGGSSSYYELPKDAKELVDLIEHKEMNFNVGNIFKACYRLGNKPGVTSLYDLKKIKWFTEREIARVEKARL